MNSTQQQQPQQHVAQKRHLPYSSPPSSQSPRKYPPPFLSHNSDKLDSPNDSSHSQSRSDSTDSTNSTDSKNSTGSCNTSNSSNSSDSSNSANTSSSVLLSSAQHPQNTFSFFTSQQYSTFASLSSIVTFSHTVLLKYSSNHAVLRMTLECLDPWISTLFLSLSCDPQSLPAAALPHASSLPNNNYACAVPHRNLPSLISLHVQSLLIPTPTSSTYSASLQTRSDLFIQCCLVAGNISCVCVTIIVMLSCFVLLLTTFRLYATTIRLCFHSKKSLVSDQTHLMFTLAVVLFIRLWVP